MNGAGSAYARPSKPQEILAAAFGIAGELQRGDEHRGQNLFGREYPRRDLLFEARKQGDALLIHGIESPRQHGLEQFLLAAEVIVHRRNVDAGRGGDLAQRRRLEAVFHEQALGRVEDLRLRRGHRRRIERDDLAAHRWTLSESCATVGVR